MESDCQRDRRAACWRRIVVIVDESEISLVTLQSAVAAAVRHQARLTIISVTPRAWPTVVVAGMCPRRLEAEAMEYVGRRVRCLVETVPADVPCTTIVRCGRAGKEVRATLTEHPGDVVFFAPRGDRGFSGSIGRWKAVRLMRRARIDFVLLEFSSAAPARSGDGWHGFDTDSGVACPACALAEVSGT